MGAGRFVSSRTFRAGGLDWNIRVYPDGWKEKKNNNAAYVSVFLTAQRMLGPTSL
jgi:speckle-type POZ protein